MSSIGAGVQTDSGADVELGVNAGHDVRHIAHVCGATCLAHVFGVCLRLNAQLQTIRHVQRRHHVIGHQRCVGLGVEFIVHLQTNRGENKQPHTVEPTLRP